MTCWVTSGDAGISTAVTEQGTGGRLRAVSEGCANGPHTAELQPLSLCELDTCVASESVLMKDTVQMWTKGGNRTKLWLSIDMTSLWARLLAGHSTKSELRVLTGHNTMSYWMLNNKFLGGGCLALRLLQ